MAKKLVRTTLLLDKYVGKIYRRDDETVEMHIYDGPHPFQDVDYNDLLIHRSQADVIKRGERFIEYVGWYPDLDERTSFLEAVKTMSRYLRDSNHSEASCVDMVRDEAESWYYCGVIV